MSDRHSIKRLVIALLIALPMSAQAKEEEQQPGCGCDEKPVSLVTNGQFKQIIPGVHLPHGWTSKHPDNVRRVMLDNSDKTKKKDKRYAMEMSGKSQLMATYGVDLISDKISFKPNTRYRCTGQTRSTGPNMIVFVKGYATVTRRVDGKVKTFDDVVYQMRKEIVATPKWSKFNLDFDVKPVLVFSDHQHRVKYLRITLWAYWPVGT